MVPDEVFAVSDNIDIVNRFYCNPFIYCVSTKPILCNNIVNKGEKFNVKFKYYFQHYGNV